MTYFKKKYMIYVSANTNKGTSLRWSLHENFRIQLV